MRRTTSALDTISTDMLDENSASLKPAVELLPYQTQIIAFLKRHDSDVWDWFATDRSRRRDADELRFELLKSTYRVERDSQSQLYQTAAEVAEALFISAPITIYQAQDPAGLNASLAFLPDEIHLILHGPIATQLTAIELRALFGHELTHYLLYQAENGDLLTATEMLQALTIDHKAHPAHFASARLLQLYGEIVCDRGALLVTNDLGAVVSMLIKVQTGITEVSAESYLRQAEEIFARGPAKTEGITHPEGFIRARALRLWAETNSEAAVAISAMIESKSELSELDLLAQLRVATWTRKLIDRLLTPKWFQTDLVRAYAKLYFEDFEFGASSTSINSLKEDLPLDAKSLVDYCCFVLLDFVTADRDLEELPLAAALVLAEELSIKERLIELARQELRLRKNQVEKIDDKKAATLREAEQSTASSP